MRSNLLCRAPAHLALKFVRWLNRQTHSTHPRWATSLHCYLGFFHKQWRKTGPFKEWPTYLLVIFDNRFLGSSSLLWLPRKLNDELRVVIHQLNGKQEVTGIETSCLIWLLQFPISMWNVGTTMFRISMFNAYISTDIKNDTDSGEG